MKHEKLISCLLSVALGTVLSLSAVACLTTGFDLMGTDMIVVTAGCFCIISFAFSLCYIASPRWPAICTLALFTLGMVLWGDLSNSIITVLKTVTFVYDSAYGWGVLVVDDGMADPTAAMIYLGAVIAFFIARTVCRGRSVVPAVVAGLTPMAACLVVTDRLPETVWIFLLLLGVMLLAFTNSVRRQDRGQGNRLLLLLLLPVVLVMQLLFGRIPQEDYDKQELAEEIYEQVVAWFEDLGLGATGFDGGEMADLTHNKHFENIEKEVMTVSATEVGVYLLRGMALDIYNGTSWTYSSKSSGLEWPTKAVLSPAGELEVKTDYIESLRFVPYFTDELYSDVNSIKNTEKRTKYGYDVYQLDNVASLLATAPAPDGYAGNTCVQLPAETRQWAEPLAKQLAAGTGTAWAQALRIVNYVQMSAVYDLETQALPEDQTDFAQWFLYESNTGYCIHYATAAAVLLRAAGIPARYVTGYQVQVESDEAVRVTNANAHAWVEAYIEGLGWIMLDPTPEHDQPLELPPVDPTTEPTTEPPGPTTEPTTEPTEPSDEPMEALPEEDKESGPDLRWLWEVLKWLLILAAILGAILGQRILRIRMRQKRLRRGNTNRQAIARWRYSVYLARLCKNKPARELYELAQKAKFSQHRIAREELEILDADILMHTRQLMETPLHYRLFYAIILAVY